MSPTQLYEKLLPRWRTSHIRHFAAADFVAARRFPDVVEHAKHFLSLHVRELPIAATYDVAMRLADEVIESVAQRE